MRHYCEHPDLPLRAFRAALGKNRPETLEGGKGGSAPSYPDPYTVANATTQTNDQTAAYNKALNLNNYSNPFGSQQTTQTGTDPTTGAPIYNTSITASQPLQSLIDSSMSAAGNANGQVSSSLYGLGNVNSQLSSLGSSISPQAAQQAATQGQNAAYAAQTQYLDPQFSQEQSSLESQLANQGLTPGSQAYTNAMTNYNNAKQQAYSNAANQSILTGQQIGTQMLNNQLNTANTQASLLGQQGSNYSQMASLAQLPYSQLSSLYSMVPGNTGTATSSASPANIAQDYQNQYQSQLNAYNSNVASANSTQSGLFGLGTAGLMAFALSDRRAKTDIEVIAPLEPGVNFYRFRYLNDPSRKVHFGVMADEVKRVRPDAVVRHASGYDIVNYDRVLGG